MRLLKLLVAAVMLFAAVACGYEPEVVVEKPDCYAYVVTQDVWGEITPHDAQKNPYATKTHKFKVGEWFFWGVLNPETAELPYLNRGNYTIPRGTFRLLTKSEVQNLMQTDKEFAKKVKRWHLLSEEGSPLLEDAAKYRVAKQGGMSAFNLFWLFIPALIIALVGYICQGMSKDLAESTTTDRKILWGLAGSVPVLFVVEAVLLFVMAYYGAFTYFEIEIAILFCIPIFAFFGLNAYGALITNSAILRSYQVSFSWARIAIYAVASFGVGSIVAAIAAFVAGVENVDLWLAIPYLLAIFAAMLVMFGIDMYRQNPKSILALPLLALLFVIGIVMIILSFVLVMLAIGVWLVFKSHVKSEEMKDRGNASLQCANCIHYGNCPSVGVPCSRHQDWR